MASQGLIHASVLLGFVSMILIVVVVIMPEWRVNSVVASDAYMRGVRAKEGLWVRCTNYQNNYFTCDMYDTPIFGLAAYLNAFRALMIIALLASVAGVICSALGMRCATIIEEDSKSKRWTIMIGGVCHIVAGSLTGICVSWYAAEVVREFNYPYNQQQLSYTFGACLYLGWVVMVLSLICGILMTCCTCFNKPVGKTTAYEYSYKPPVAQEKYSYPPPAVETYKQDPIYKDRSGYRKSDYRQSKHSNHHSHHSSHYSGHRDHRASSFTSSHSHRSSLHRDSPKSSHTRHDSDIARASGFV
ncbi:claudin-1-like isoform X4 [Clavelina lepadiformis]|uniref:claudin-1-like isoform X4 n=1 Tax=Clavelina lepadiformis TaxID=159417 RepID=UPI004042C098